MEKKFRTLSAYLPSRRPSIPPALPFALQNGYGTSAAGQGIVVGTTGRTCPATASGRVTDATAHQASGDALSGDCNCAPMARRLYRSNKADGGILRQHQKRRRPGTTRTVSIL